MLSAAFGCGERIVIPAVPNEGGARTEILVVGIEGADAPESIFVADLAEPSTPIRFELVAERRLEAFLLKGTLEELGLEEGPQSLLEGEPPAMFEAWTATAKPGAPAVWQRQRTPRWLHAVRLPMTDAQACLEGGACLVDGACKPDCGPIEEPAAPEAVRPPSGACPAGWSTVEVEVGNVCSPFATVQECAPDELQLPGSPACAAIGRPCGTEEFPEGALGEVLYRVAPRGDDGGDGTVDSPFATIAGALASVPDGAHIVVAAGSYDAPLTVERPVRISGVCPSRVSLSAVVIADAVEIEDVTLEALTVRGEATLRGVAVAGDGIRVDAAARLTLDSVSVDGGAVGLLVDDALVRGAGLVIRGTALRGASLRGDVMLEDVVIHGGGASSVRVRGGDVRFERLVVLAASGISAEDATLRIDDALVVDSSSVGIRLEAVTAQLSNIWLDRSSMTVTDTELSLEDVVVTDATRSIAFTADDSAVSLARVALLRGGDTGFVVRTSTLTIADLAVHDLAGGRRSAALVLSDVVLGEARRMSFQDLGAPAIDVRDTSGGLISDVRIVGEERGRCLLCAGICLGRGAEVTVSRVEIADVEGAAIAIDQNEAQLFDVRITRPGRGASCTATSGPATLAVGIVNDNAGASFTRFAVVDPAYAGIRILATQGFLRTPTLERGVVRGAQVGLEVGVDTDYAATIDRVDLSDNVRPVLRASAN